MNCNIILYCLQYFDCKAESLIVLIEDQVADYFYAINRICHIPSWLMNLILLLTDRYNKQ